MRLKNLMRRELKARPSGLGPLLGVHGESHEERIERVYGRLGDPVRVGRLGIS